VRPSSREGENMLLSIYLDEILSTMGKADQDNIKKE
jgi:hypothetical protein